MASFIFLAGDEIILLPHSRWMAHHFSGMYYGKASDTSLNMEADLKHFQSLCEEYYGKFLTKAEIKGIMEGRDIWLDTTEISKRLGKL
jgi:ATP-dependent protease ClpP protease subunit